MLIYPDKSEHSIKVPYATWASAQITSQIAHILLSEVLGYSTSLMASILRSSDPINMEAGCVDADDATCAVRDATNPAVHISIETWLFGISWADDLPSSIRPPIMRVFNYETLDGYYIWPSVHQAGLASKDHVPLNE